MTSPKEVYLPTPFHMPEIVEGHSTTHEKRARTCRIHVLPDGGRSLHSSRPFLAEGIQIAAIACHSDSIFPVMD